MRDPKLRRQIAFEAARLMYSRQETEYFRAKMKAARMICQGWVKPSDLPSNREIRDEIQRFAFLYEGESRFDKLREMRIEALRIMRLLKNFRPHLIGSTLTGFVRSGSDIDIHVFSSTVEPILAVFEQENLVWDVEHKRVRKHGEERVFTHVHLKHRFPIELTMYPLDKASYVFKSSITGKAIERASVAQLEEFLQKEYPDLVIDASLTDDIDAQIDRFAVYRSLLVPLGKVKQSRKHHPEGDALYHSLQVFDLACDAIPWDEEFLLAALLHDVGKAIDPHDHVTAGLEALQEVITQRTYWLIKHHMDAHRLKDGSLGARARRRLQQSEDFDELMLLERCDHNGRQVGVEVPDVEEALDYIEDLARQCG